MSKSKIKKEISDLNKQLKEASKDYDRVASRSINPDMDGAVIRALGIKQNLESKLLSLKSQLADFLSN